MSKLRNCALLLLFCSPFAFADEFLYSFVNSDGSTSWSFSDTSLVTSQNVPDNQCQGGLNCWNPGTFTEQLYGYFFFYDFTGANGYVANDYMYAGLSISDIPGPGIYDYDYTAVNTYEVSTTTGYTTEYSYSTGFGVLTVTPVPEPSYVAPLSIATGVLIMAIAPWLCRRKRSASRC